MQKNHLKSIQCLLHGQEELGKMVAIGGGMADGKGKGHQQPAVDRRKFPAGDNGEQIGRAAVIDGSIGFIAEPGHAGDAEEIFRLIFLDLDAFFVPIGCQIGKDIPVEGIKISIIEAPKIGKGMVVLMEDGEIGMQIGIGAGRTGFVHIGAKLSALGNDLPRQGDEGREEPQPLFLDFFPKMGYIQTDSHAVDGLDKALGVIVKMAAAGPCFSVVGGKNAAFHKIILSVFMIQENCPKEKKNPFRRGRECFY